MDSESDYHVMKDEETETNDVWPVALWPQNLKWVGFALIATICFAVSGYILGQLAAAGVTPKYLNSLGYFTISCLILITKQLNYQRYWRGLSNEEKKETPHFAGIW